MGSLVASFVYTSACCSGVSGTSGGRVRIYDARCQRGIVDEACPGFGLWGDHQIEMDSAVAAAASPLFVAIAKMFRVRRKFAASEVAGSAIYYHSVPSCSEPGHAHGLVVHQPQNRKRSSIYHCVPAH